jgi:hypothetical protein
MNVTQIQSVPARGVSVLQEELLPKLDAAR